MTGRDQDCQQLGADSARHVTHRWRCLSRGRRRRPRNAKLPTVTTASRPIAPDTNGQHPDAGSCPGRDQGCRASPPRRFAGFTRVSTQVLTLPERCSCRRRRGAPWTRPGHHLFASPGMAPLHRSRRQSQHSGADFPARRPDGIAGADATTDCLEAVQASRRTVSTHVLTCARWPGRDDARGFRLSVVTTSVGPLPHEGQHRRADFAAGRLRWDGGCLLRLLRQLQTGKLGGGHSAPTC